MFYAMPDTPTVLESPGNLKQPKCVILIKTNLYCLDTTIQSLG